MCEKEREFFYLKIKIEEKKLSKYVEFEAQLNDFFLDKLYLINELAMFVQKGVNHN